MARGMGWLLWTGRGRGDSLVRTRFNAISRTRQASMCLVFSPVSEMKRIPTTGSKQAETWRAGGLQKRRFCDGPASDAGGSEEGSSSAGRAMRSRTG